MSKSQHSNRLIRLDVFEREATNTHCPYSQLLVDVIDKALIDYSKHKSILDKGKEWWSKKLKHNNSASAWRNGETARLFLFKGGLENCKEMGLRINPKRIKERISQSDWSYKGIEEVAECA